jgi:homoserine dehydrogenase
MSRALRIGIFGFGHVGRGLYDLVRDEPALRVERVCVRDVAKPRGLPRSLVTGDARLLLGDPEIQCVVELIDDADAAFDIASQALLRGKCVVTANKRMLAEHLPALLALQRQHHGILLHEAAVCGSIPILRALDVYHGGDDLTAIEGVLNGTCNYILTGAMEDGLDLAPALARAQEQGFAESDPTLDLRGDDSRFKLVLLALHAFGVVLEPEAIPRAGIQNLRAEDLDFARQRGWSLRLLGTLRRDGDRLAAFVLPRFLHPAHELFGVRAEHNGVVVESPACGRQLFAGRGAGGAATGFAVLQDLRRIAAGAHASVPKLGSFPLPCIARDAAIEIYARMSDGDPLQAIPFARVARTGQLGACRWAIGTVSLDALAPALTEPRLFVAQTSHGDIHWPAAAAEAAA